MPHIQRSFYTRTQVEYVFNYIINPDNLPVWNCNLVSIKNQSGPVATGTSWIQVFKLYGRTTELPCRVLEYEPPFRFISEATLPLGVRLLLSFELEPQGSGTKTTYTANYTLPGGLLGRFADKLLESRARRDAAQNIAKLKAILQKGKVTKC